MHNKLELIIDNPLNNKVEYLDMGDFDISLNYSFNDIRDISKRNGSYSKTITVPATKNNNYVLGGLFDINADFDRFDPNKKATAKLLVNSETVIDGIMYLSQINKLNNVDSQGNLMYYEIVLYTNVIDLLSELGDLRLSDLTTLDEYNHIYEANNIQASWTNTEGYVYPMYGEKGQSPLYKSEHFFPATFYKTALDSIIDEAGFGWGGNLKTNPQFLREILPFTGRSLPKVTAADRALRAIDASILANTTIDFDGCDLGSSASIIGAGYWRVGSSLTRENLPFNNIVLDPSGQFDTNTHIWTVGATGAYKLKINNAFNILWDHGSNSDAETSGYEYQVEVDVERKPAGGIFTAVDSFVSTGYQAPLQINSGTTASTPHTLDFQTISLDFQQGEEVRLSVTIYKISGQSYIQAGTASSLITTMHTRLRFTGVNDLAVISVSDIISIGDEVRLKEFLPKIKQKDLITDLIKRYNLVIYPDPQNPKILLFDTYANYYADNTEILDWSDKLDYSKDTSIRMLSELQSKAIKFTYTAEKNLEGANEEYSNRTGEIYGEREIAFNNDFVTGEQLIQSPFSPTPTVKTAFGAYTPSINRDVPEGSPRVLYYGGLKDLEGSQSFTFNAGVALGSYPYAGHYDDPINPSLDLNFDWCREYFYDEYNLTTVNQFNTYWSAYINQIQKGKMLTAYFRLDESDITKVKDTMSYKVWIKDAYYYINRIFDYNPLRTGLTKVEMIKVAVLGNYLETNPYQEFIAGGINCPGDIISVPGLIGFFAITIYQSLSGVPMTLSCCDGLGGYFNNTTGVCRSLATITSDKISPAVIVGAPLGINTVGPVVSGEGNSSGGVSAIPILNAAGDMKSLAVINKQLIVGDDNTARFNGVSVIGNGNIVSNSGVSILNGSGNTITSIGTTLIGTNNQTIEDAGKVYLGNKLSVDVETGNMFQDGGKLDRVFEKSIRITSAEVLELDITPVRLISGVGATEYAVISGVSMYLDYNTTAYTGDNDLEVYIDGAANDYFIGEQFLTPTVEGAFDFEKLIPTTVGNQSVLGGDGYIRLKNSTADGDSDIIITIEYRIIDISGY